MIYELTLAGFDISDSTTDHLIKWVKASSRAVLDRWIIETYPLQVVEVREMPWAKNYTAEDGIDHFVNTNK